MAATTNELRNTVKAVCRNADGDILLIRKSYKKEKDRYTLPGGTQDPGETLLETLKRECREEIACDVEVLQLHYVCEITKPTRNGKIPRHKVEFGFSCSVPESYQPRMGKKPDSHQVDVHWVPIDKLESITITPDGLAKILMQEEPFIGYCGVMGSD